MKKLFRFWELLEGRSSRPLPRNGIEARELVNKRFLKIK